MEHLQPPKSMDLSLGDGAANATTWKQWRETFEVYMSASGLDEKTEKVKKSVMLLSIGDEGRKIKKTMTDVVDEVGDNETSYEDLVKKFDVHFIGKTNVTFERHLFRKITQGSRKFGIFLTEVQTQAAKCKFEGQFEGQICDQIIFGVKGDELRKRLLGAIPEGNLDKIINMCKHWEVVGEQLNKMKEPESSTVQAVQSQKGTRDPEPSYRYAGRGRGCYGRPNYRGQYRGRGRPNYGRMDNPQQDTAPRSEASDSYQRRSKCPRCDTSHGYKNCPAWNKRCAKCQGLGHFTICCRTKNYSNTHQVRYTDYDYETEPYDYEMHETETDEYYITDAINCVHVDSVGSNESQSMVGSENNNDGSESETNVDCITENVHNVNSDSKLEWYVTARIGVKQVSVKIKLDTGSMVNILPVHIVINDN